MAQTYSASVKSNFYVMCVYMCASVCASVYVGALGDRKRAVGSPGAGAKDAVVVSCPVWVRGSKLWSSSRAVASAFIH